jgi:hypothetical protein
VLKNLVFRIGLLILLALMLIPSRDSPYRAESFHGIAEPYSFSIFSWETRNLFNKWGWELRELGRKDELSRSEKLRLVENYFSSRGEATLKNRVEAIIEEQVSEVLSGEGLGMGGVIFPPVDFEWEMPPHILVISPIERIELLETINLRVELSPHEVSSIEARAEEIGVSALVERVGGIATYPSMVSKGNSLDTTLSTVAHEWTHHYLFFHPLGRHCSASSQMRTINETIADMVGDEVSSRVLSRYYGRQKVKTRVNPPAFDFNKEMRETRLAVDRYLERGEVEEAERFMKERREFLQAKGYYIRRLNQAYFAWHGTYADTPASTSPVGGATQIAEETKCLFG